MWKVTTAIAVQLNCCPETVMGLVHTVGDRSRGRDTANRRNAATRRETVEQPSHFASISIALLSSRARRRCAMSRRQSPLIAIIGVPSSVMSGK